MATTKKDEKKGNKGVDVNRAMNVAKALLKTGFAEMKFQQMLDRYQLAILNADYSSEARTRRAEKLKEDALKLDEKFAGIVGEDGKPVERVSNWVPLANYFNETLAHLKEEHFTLEGKMNASKDIQKAMLLKPTKEQEQVIITFHTNRARANFDKVLQIRALLEYKKLLKKAAPKLPSEEELANITAGQE